MYRNIFVIIAIITFSNMLNAQTYNELKDQRDGYVYKTIQIGDQVWMAENLRYKTKGSWCYENDSTNCEKYGRLYSQKSAMESCPTGWHLPSDDEWKLLEQHLGMSKADAGKFNGWRGSNQGTQLLTDSTLGFNVLLAGYRNPPANNMLQGTHAFFWTSTVKNTLAYMRQFYEKQPKIFRRVRPVNWAFSVRCVKNRE